MIEFKSRDFKTVLKQERLKAGWTQKKMAEILNVTDRAYQYYEAGTREPTLENLIRIAIVLNVSIDYLVGRTDCPDMVVLDKDGKPMIVVETMLPPDSGACP